MSMMDGDYHLPQSRENAAEDYEVDDVGSTSSVSSTYSMSSMSSMSRHESRLCFVTVGATAGFRQLLAEIIKPEFLQRLAHYKFRRLEVQCGPDYDWFAEQVEALPDDYGIDIRSFTYTKNMSLCYVRCRGEAGLRLAGCVITHAGSSNVLEVKRTQAPLIAVPNPAITDKHQEDLADVMEDQGWGISGELGQLTVALARSQELVAQEMLRQELYLAELDEVLSDFEQENEGRGEDLEGLARIAND
ncbi:hypothetical protein B0T26DRAFT_492475 [Lasiosphaeria miniovina]|uniref:UDP-N-acetylglucosamine transferase subunit ALG13 n=1 Tax=Lasiosphaeria miniovina TaxID=1954250 RepID=A0AA40DH20_9PEZI|nr:uncharacterized protein B0T26DRAFT_492475 [Lasiosphaeria miniovina]KAK0703219.1 hypothetical protein B0T26DRAFT_492475 [Lasiosphaeria miniovina]